jgi:hypothetical protein
MRIHLTLKASFPYPKRFTSELSRISKSAEKNTDSITDFHE